MRRKPGTLLPIEQSILAAGLELQRLGETEFYGYLLAKELQELEAARRLTSFGTLYKALDRLEAAGLVESRWEEIEDAPRQRRPRRRLYQITAAGAAAHAATAPAAQPQLGVLGEGASA